MKKLLLVEDETSVVSFLQKGLRENFALTVATTGQEGFRLATAMGFDLIILDIMLPDMNGLVICTKLRENNVQTPILFLSALSSTENIALGLNTGADDYLGKPFKFIELNARIHALLRRNENNSQQLKSKQENLYSVADLTVDDDAKTVDRRGNTVSLTATEYRLLLALIKNKGKVMSRIDLLEEVWGITFNLETNVVDVYINYLRKKLDGDANAKLIHTAVGMGYVMKEI